jgi:hypothetical protein
MPDFKVRFEQSNGNWMVLEHTPAWTPADLDGRQVRMLQSYPVPGLLRMETTEWDGAVALRYALDGKRMLSQVMRTARWPMEQGVALLYRLAEAAEQCRPFLLDAERLVLHEDYMFVGEDDLDLRLAYVPIRSCGAPDRFRSDLERWLVRWTGCLAEPDGALLQRLFRLAASPDFTFRSLILLIREYPFGHASQPPAAEKEASPYAAPPVRPPLAADLEGDASADPAFPGDGMPPLSAQTLPSQAEAFAPEDAPSPGSGKRLRLWLLTAATAAVAAVWKSLYAGQPDRQHLLLSLAATLAVAGGTAGLWSRLLGRKSEAAPLPDPEREDAPFADAGLHGRLEPAWEEAVSSRAGAGGEPEPLRNGRRFPAFGRDEKPGPAPDAWPEEPWTANPTGHLLPPSDATVFLPTQQPAASAAGCHLEWETAADRPRRIPLTGRSIVIGRSSEASQHVDETEGISRTHLELIREGEKWTAKDLGSRNGSWLNGEPMVPYQLYPLRHGDRIQLGTSMYRYVRSDAQAR